MFAVRYDLWCGLKGSWWLRETNTPLWPGYPLDRRSELGHSDQPAGCVFKWKVDQLLSWSCQIAPPHGSWSNRARGRVRAYPKWEYSRSCSPNIRAPWHCPCCRIFTCWALWWVGPQRPNFLTWTWNLILLQQRKPNVTNCHLIKIQNILW